MKVLSKLLRTLLSVLFVLFVSVIATFFISIFNSDGVLKAIDIFKNLF